LTTQTKADSKLFRLQTIRFQGPLAQLGRAPDS
jgi:hypothetical protein